MTMAAKSVAAAAILGLASMTASASAETTLAFTNFRTRSGTFARPDGRFLITPTHPSHHLSHQGKQSIKKHSLTKTHSYRKFHDYGWNKLIPDDNTEIDTVPEELQSNASPARGAPEGTNVMAYIRSISEFPSLTTTGDDRAVLRLARSAFLETQLPTSEALITPMTIHVLNFVLFPSPHIRDNESDDEEYLGLPIFGADIVSLPGNKHLVALDFQPVLPLGEEGGASLFPKQYSHLESKLEAIHSKYQKSDDACSEPLLAWGGDIPPQAERFFSPYALWTRLADDNALDTVSTVVWEAFQEYTDLYLELMNAVQDDVNAGKLKVVDAPQETDDKNPVFDGQIDYLEYRRTNDPARPMLQRLYGNEWAESVIGDVLFPNL